MAGIAIPLKCTLFGSLTIDQGTCMTIFNTENDSKIEHM